MTHNNGTITGDGQESSPVPSQERLCEICSRQLSEARLKAQPTARLCVPCLQDSGDVTLLKRHDQIIGTLENQEVVSTYYKTPSSYLAQKIAKEQKTLDARPPRILKPRINFKPVFWSDFNEQHY